MPISMTCAPEAFRPSLSAATSSGPERRPSRPTANVGAPRWRASEPSARPMACTIAGVSVRPTMPRTS
jgi:hypothetical protein